MQVFTIWQAFAYLSKFIKNENRIIYELEIFKNNCISKFQLDEIILSVEKNK